MRIRFSLPIIFGTKRKMFSVSVVIFEDSVEETLEMNYVSLLELLSELIIFEIFSMIKYPIFD